MTYYYQFIALDGASDDILEKIGQEVGKIVVDIPAWVVDIDESPLLLMGYVVQIMSAYIK